MKKLMKVIVTSFAIMFMSGISGITANAQSVNESEPNDSMETAQTISANRETASGCVNGSYTGQYVVNGTTSINDSDWYKVYLSAGTQYVTCNGSAFEFYIYDSNGNLFDWATYNKPGFGASAYEFTASSTGYTPYDKETADYVNFWNSLVKENPSGVYMKFSNEEIRSRLTKAAIENGFFTVTIGGHSVTHFLSQGKNASAVHSKEQYDSRYSMMTNGRFFKQFEAGQKVMIGGKEYILGEDKKLDIEYGEDVFDIQTGFSEGT